MDKSPDAFRTISEVAEWLGVQTHVLRFWESKFSQVKPVKRAGGRRYYRPSDMALLGGIRKLLHDDGMTIKGVQKLLREEGVNHVASFSQALDTPVESDPEPKTHVAENVVRFQARPEDRETAEDGAVSAAPPPANSEPAADIPVADAEPELPELEIAPEPAPEPAAPAVAPTPEVAADAAAPDAAEATEDATPAEEASPLPSFLTQPMGGGPAEPAEPAKPRIVDAPDPPTEAEIATHPGTLSRVGGLPPIPPELAREMLPLVGRLAVLRDRLASTG